MQMRPEPETKWSSNPDWLPKVEMSLVKVRPYAGHEDEFFWADVSLCLKAEHEEREDGSGGNECIGELAIRVPVNIRDLAAIEKYSAKRIKELLFGAPEWVLAFRAWPDPAP